MQGWLERSSTKSWDLNRKSLRLELDSSLPLMGAQLRRIVQPALTAYNKNASLILNESAPSRAMQREVLDLGMQLRTALRTTEALSASWDDLLDQIQSPSVEPSKCMGLFQCLRGLLELAGIDPRSRLREVRVHLTGQHFEILARRHARENGEQTHAQMPPVRERIRSAGDELLRPPRMAHCVAWLQYDSAQVPEFIFEAGHVTFFDAPWALPNARLADGQGFAYKAELQAVLEEEQNGWWTDKGPEASTSFVIARVDLGTHNVESALKRAEANVQSLLAVATTWSGGIRWRRAGPALLIADGEFASSSRRAGPPKDFVDTLGIGITRDEIRDQIPKLAEAMTHSALPSELEEALRLLAEAGSEHSRESTFGNVRNLHERSAIVLRDQAVEHVAAMAGLTVHELDTELMIVWAYSKWLNDTGYGVDALLDRTSHQEATRELRTRVTGSEYGQRLMLDQASACEAELLALCDTDLNRRRLRSDLKGVRNASHYLRVTEGHERTFFLLMDRHRRVRNSLVHGNPVHPRVVSTVVHAAVLRSDQAVKLALSAFTQRMPLAKLLAENRADTEASLYTIRSGTSWLDMWADNAMDAP